MERAKKTMIEDRFYVYEHINPSTGQVFYVGKGTKNRARVRSGRNKMWKSIAEKSGFEVRFVATHLDEELANLMEVELIDLRRRLGHQIANITDGGEAFMVGMWRDDRVREQHKASQHKRWSSGAARASQSERLREAYKDGALRKAVGDSVRAVLSDAEVRRRMREAASTNRRKPEARAAAADQMRRRMADPLLSAASRAASRRQATKVTCNETGVTFDSISDAVSWLHSIGHQKAKDSAICHACAGRRKTAYGYSWSKPETQQTRAAERITIVN